MNELENLKSNPILALTVQYHEDPGIQLIMWLTQIMAAFKDLPDEEKEIAVRWFTARYGKNLK